MYLVIDKLIGRDGPDVVARVKTPLTTHEFSVHPRSLSIDADDRPLLDIGYPVYRKTVGDQVYLMVDLSRETYQGSTRIEVLESSVVDPTMIMTSHYLAHYPEPKLEPDPKPEPQPDPAPLPSTVISRPPYAMGGGEFLNAEYRPRTANNVNPGDIVIVGVCHDQSTTNRAGARSGPNAIRIASQMLCETKQQRPIVDMGNLVPPAPDLLLDVERTAEMIYSRGGFPIFLGGDHSITLQIMRGLYRVTKAPIHIVHFDAHSDTWSENWGMKYGHGNWLYHAINEGLVSKRSFHIGSRSSMDADTEGFLRNNIEFVHTAREVHEDTKRTIDELGVLISSVTQGAPVYLTFDIDCLDPAFAPGTGTPEVGGLATWQIMSLFRPGPRNTYWSRHINWIGMDMVEVSPPYDHADITSLAAASIVQAQIEALRPA